MAKYLIWCFNNDTRTEYKESSKRKAERIYSQAIKSNLYSSVVLRVEKNLHGYAIKSWSKNDEI